MTEVTRRQWIAAGGVVLAEACGRKKATGYDGYALVATSGDDTLAVVDLTAFKLVKPIHLGAPPTALVAGPLESRTYVLSGSTGTVHIVDRNLNRAASRKVADELFDIAMAPDGKHVVAIATGGRELIVIDGSSLQVVRRHNLEAQPIGLDIASSQHAAVSSGEHGVVELLNLKNGQHVRTRLSGRIGAVRFRRDGALLLVANLHDRLLTALEIPSLRVVADLPVAMQPDNLCFNSDGGQLFVSGAGMDGVAIVFPYNTLEVEQTVLAGRSPGVMACSETPGYLFVASRNASDVCIFDITTRKMIGIVETGGVPGHMAITPDSQYALVLAEKSGDMAVIHIPAIRGNKWKSGASLFTIIPVGDKPVDLAIMPREV
ncbi:MAG: YncE family protein [Bryobacteraceae bacterium]